VSSAHFLGLPPRFRRKASHPAQAPSLRMR